MRLTIIPIDGAVYKDGASYHALDLSFIPASIHAFQWYETFGELEHKSNFINGEVVKPSNEIVNELPDWAQQALVKWEEAEAARLAAEEEARLAAETALGDSDAVIN